MRKSCWPHRLKRGLELWASQAETWVRVVTEAAPGELFLYSDKNPRSKFLGLGLEVLASQAETWVRVVDLTG